MNYIKINKFLLFLFFVLLTMHVVHSIFNININLLFSIYSLYLFVLIKFVPTEKFTINNLLIFIFLNILGLVGTVTSGSKLQILIMFAASIPFLLINVHYKLLTSNFIIVLFVKLNLLLLVGGLIGFSYAILNGPSLYQTLNLETNYPLELYLTTFTNVLDTNFIRPSGLFSEPGALAMFSVLVVCLNELHNGKKVSSLLILILSLITFSPIILFVLIIYLIYSTDRKVFLPSLFSLVLIFSSIFIFYLIFQDAFDQLLFGRFEVVDGRFVGDNRSNQIDNFYENITWEIFFSGYSVLYGVLDEVDITSNPFTILFFQGIYVSIPYFILLFYLFITFLKNNNSTKKFVSLSLIILLLQRPYIYSLYWTYFISLVFISFLNFDKIKK